MIQSPLPKLTEVRVAETVLKNKSPTPTPTVMGPRKRRITLHGPLNTVRQWGQQISEFIVWPQPTIQNLASIVRSVVSTRRPSVPSITSLTRQATLSWRRSDYPFWREAYYGKTQGLEVSGLLIKPLVSKIAAWTLGRAPKWRCGSERTTELFTQWWTTWHAEILRGWRAALKQGDAFLVVNSDLSITLLPPDCVEPIVDPDNFGIIIGWRVVQVLPHPTERRKMVMYDEYYADRRVQWIEIDYQRQSQRVFRNLLGIIPVIHIYNQPENGEIFGHAEAEALLGALQRYGIIFDAAVEGNILQGRPTPVITFQTLKDLDAFWKQYGTKVATTKADGSAETTAYLDVDLSQIITMTNGSFEYKSPGSFTADTANLLKLLFYLILEHSELPEFIFGNAIESSRASAETQMPVFIEFIKMRRGEMVKWLLQLARVVLGYLALTNPGIDTVTSPDLQWEPLDQDDGRLTFDAVKWAWESGLIDNNTALTLIPPEIDDIPEVLRKAREDKLKRQEDAITFQQRQSELASQNQPNNGDETPQPPSARRGTSTTNGRDPQRNSAQNRNGTGRVVELMPIPATTAVLEPPLSYHWDIHDEDEESGQI